jgi:hypothetical protein
LVPDFANGDFNTPDIIWEDLTVNNNPNYSMLLNNTMLDFVNANFLTQLIITPTRNDNILDLVLSTNPDIIYNLEIRSSHMISGVLKSPLIMMLGSTSSFLHVNLDTDSCSWLMISG